MNTPPRKPLADAGRDKQRDPTDITDVITDAGNPHLMSCPSRHRLDAICNCIASVPDGKRFDVFAEPFFGEEAEFTADEEATLP